METVDFSRCPYHAALKEQLNEALENLSKRADRHDEQVIANTATIVEMKEKAAVTREQTTMIFTILGEIKQSLKELTLAIKEIPSEQEVKIDAKIKELREQKTTAKWYESEVGKFAIKGAVILVLLLAAAAIGQSAIKELVPMLAN